MKLTRYTVNLTESKGLQGVGPEGSRQECQLPGTPRTDPDVRNCLIGLLPLGMTQSAPMGKDAEQCAAFGGTSILDLANDADSQ